MDEFERFKKKFNSSSLSAEALAEQLENVDQRIIDYAKTCKNGEMTTEGFKASIDTMSFSAKAGKVALQALATAGNMLLFTAISKGIELAVKGIDNLIHSSERCKERVDNLMSSYQSALDEANRNADTVETLASRYEELSKGVNNLGETYGLTAEEKEEYHNICNQIADMFPTLVQGYTNEGNAILSLKGNVEQLREAYKEAQQEAYNMLIMSGKDSDGNDIIKNWDNVSTKDDFSFIAHTSETEARDALQRLYEIANSGSVDLFKNTFSAYEKEFAGNFSKVSDAIDKTNWINLNEEDLKSMLPSIQSYIQTYQAEIDSALKNVQTLANAYLMTNQDFAKLDEQSKSTASIIVNSIDESIANGFTDKVDVGEYVTNIIDTLRTNTDVRDALVGLFQLDTSEMQPDDAKATIDQYINFIANILGEDSLELKVRLGFDDVDTVASNYNTVMRKAADKFAAKTPSAKESRIAYDTELDAVSKFAEENSINTQDEISFWNKCIEESDTREEAMDKYLKSSVENLEPQTFDLSTYKDQLSNITSAISTLRSALDSFNSGDLSKIQVLDLMQQFPDLVPYIDLTAEGLSTLISQQPDSLIQNLQTLKSSLTTDAEREQVDLLVDSLQRLSSYGDSGIEAYATAIGNTWGDTANVIEGVITQFENLAKVQETVADGLTMSATAAAELAKMYPEILDHAQVTADGQNCSRILS